MCGFAGLWAPQADQPELLLRAAEAMALTLAHRGPDDHGVWADPEGAVALAHRRLSVVDLSPLGHQPMTSVDDRWVIAFNGEIYNFLDLRRRLERTGGTFRGGSDTEVLLEAVRQWGVEETLEALEGMFAFALWDRRHGALHLARDRFGEKPLYLGWVGDRLAFGSELKALAAAPGFAPAIDRNAVARYLRRNCIPAPDTIYTGIRKLVPGHMLTVTRGDAAGSALTSRPYWSADDAVADARSRPLAGTPEELADIVEAALGNSVAARMVADVPVGAFLSGGIDSSLIVALMQERSDRPVHTFTVGFAERAFDESEDAAAVARHLGTEHTPLMVRDADAEAVIPELPKIWDEPFADISQIPVLLVSRLARSQVAVALSGDAGDELFAGYNRHAYVERLWGRAGGWPAPLRRALGSAAGAVPPELIERLAGVGGVAPKRFQVRNPSTKITKVAKVLAASGPKDAYDALTSHWDDAESLVLGAGPRLHRAPLGPELAGITEHMLWADTVSYLPDDILVKVDRAAMAVALETRVPFLDRQVFDVAWRLPLDMKLHEGTTKWILREVLYRHVPRSLVDRPKMGFGLPIGAWLRGPLRPWAEELLAERRLMGQGLLDPAPIRRAWALHLSGTRDLAYELWDILALQAWIDEWMPGLSR